jgi:hypothetical protein
VIHTLRNYRVLDAPVALPAVAQGEGSRNRQLQAHLRDRLFEVSRRNKLLYFRQSQQTLNLTVSSFRAMLDVRNIKEEQLFYWHEGVAKQVCSEAPIPLQKYLRFEDLPFLPSQLDAIRTAASVTRTSTAVRNCDWPCACFAGITSRKTRTNVSPRHCCCCQ